MWHWLHSIHAEKTKTRGKISCRIYQHVSSRFHRSTNNALISTFFSLTTSSTCFSPHIKSQRSVSWNTSSMWDQELRLCCFFTLRCGLRTTPVKDRTVRELWGDGEATRGGVSLSKKTFCQRYLPAEPGCCCSCVGRNQKGPGWVWDSGLESYQ